MAEARSSPKAKGAIITSIIQGEMKEGCVIKKYVIYGNIWESMGIYADVYIHSHTLPSGTHTSSMQIKIF
jgi:hypothetical protein